MCPELRDSLPAERQVITRVGAVGVALLLGVGATACTDGSGGEPFARPLVSDEAAAAALGQPDSTRDAIALALRVAALDTGEAATGALATASVLADAYAAAWSDSFFVRRVESFTAAPPHDRRRMAEADSLWRSGRVALGRQGATTAMPMWRRSLELASLADDSAGGAAALSGLGAGFYMAGTLDSASLYLDEALRWARAVGDLRTTGNALGMSASVAKDLGETGRAAELYEAALEIRPRSGDTRGMAADHNNLGLLRRSLGDLTGATRAFERALEINRASDNRRALAVNLTNLGDLASVRGEYAGALEHYEEALEINRSSGDVAETAFVLHDLGLLEARRGAYGRARELLSQALAIHAESGADLEAASVSTDLASVQAAIGDLGAAIATLGRAEEHARGAPASIQGALALARAELAVQLGSLAEADEGYGEAERAFGEAGDLAGRAEAQQGRALLLVARDDVPGALRLLTLAARAHDEAGDPRAAAIIRLLTGDVHREAGDTAAARLEYDRALAIFARLGDRTLESVSLTALGDVALDRGAPLAAESLYRKGLERLGAARSEGARWRLHAGLAEALRRRGADGAAAAELQAAVAGIDRIAATLRNDGRRAGFLSDKWDVYGSLSLIQRDRGLPEEAFTTSERMRARETLALLGQTRVATRSAPSAREQDLRRRIAELNRRIEAYESGSVERRETPIGGGSLDEALEALAAVQSDYGDVLRSVRESDPSFARLVEATPVGWRDVARRLKADEVFLQYLLTDSASTVFVVTAGEVAALDLDVDGRTLANLVDFARNAIGRPGDRPTGSLWDGAIRRLHHHLIGPVEEGGFLEGRRRLIVSPHAELHFLPFGVLRSGTPGSPFLVERFEIVYAPSASVWVRLADRAPPTATRVLALAPYPDRLPASRTEVEAIRTVHGRRGATILVGSAASERALRLEAPRHGTLHLATLGTLNKHNPLFSHVALAASDTDDGRLEAHEVFDLDLDGQLVVLSACQTAVGSGARSDVPAGDDWVGLVQSFIQAGAGGVLASLWSVDDHATALLMERFYRARAAGESESKALADAQTALSREPETAHPFFWAGFVLNGG